MYSGYLSQNISRLVVEVLPVTPNSTSGLEGFSVSLGLRLSPYKIIELLNRYQSWLTKKHSSYKAREHLSCSNANRFKSKFVLFFSKTKWNRKSLETRCAVWCNRQHLHHQSWNILAEVPAVHSRSSAPVSCCVDGCWVFSDQLSTLQSAWNILQTYVSWLNNHMQRDISSLFILATRSSGKIAHLNTPNPTYSVWTSLVWTRFGSCCSSSAHCCRWCSWVTFTVFACFILYSTTISSSEFCDQSPRMVQFYMIIVLLPCASCLQVNLCCGWRF